MRPDRLISVTERNGNSDLDRHRFEAGEVSRAIEAGDVTLNLELPKSVHTRVTKARRKEAHERFVAWAYFLSLGIVRVARGRVPSKEISQRFLFGRSGILLSNESREFGGLRRARATRIVKREELERSVGFTRVDEARARALQFLPQCWVGLDGPRALAATLLRD
jgi:hypothetical protein